MRPGSAGTRWARTAAAAPSCAWPGCGPSWWSTVADRDAEEGPSGRRRGAREVALGAAAVLVAIGVSAFGLAGLLVTVSVVAVAAAAMLLLRVPAAPPRPRPR